MRRTFHLILMVFASFIYVSAQSVDSGALERELLQTSKQIFEAFFRGDKATFDLMLTDDFILSSGHGTLTKSAVMKDMTALNFQPKQNGKTNDFAETISEVQVRRYGDVALLNYTDEGISPLDPSKNYKVKTTEIFYRQNGKWVLAAKHISDISETKNPEKPVDVKAPTTAAPKKAWPVDNAYGVPVEIASDKIIKAMAGERRDVYLFIEPKHFTAENVERIFKGWADASKTPEVLNVTLYSDKEMLMRAIRSGTIFIEFNYDSPEGRAAASAFHPASSGYFRATYYRIKRWNGGNPYIEERYEYSPKAEEPEMVKVTVRDKQ